MYKGIRDGFDAKNFHKKCDKKGETITIVKSKIHERTFGGYTDIDWDSADGEV